MSNLKQQIVADMKAMMKAKNKQNLTTIRMLLAAIKQKEIDERIELTNEDVVAIVGKMIKQRKDSITQFTQAGRDELAQNEAQEITVIEGYMPQQMSETEIDDSIEKTLLEMDSPSMKDMGKIMGTLKGRLAGKADMAMVSQRLKTKLN